MLKVFPKENRALVQGVNVVKRHQRQTQTQQAGIVTKEAADPSVEYRACRPQDGQGDAHWYTRRWATAAGSALRRSPVRSSMSDAG